MQHKRWPIAGMMLAVLTLISSNGCSPPQPDADELILYVKSARVHAKVRRQWPEGQAYVDKVMAADAEVRESLDALVAVSRGDDLLGPDEGEWRSEEVLRSKIEDLEQMLGEEATTERADALKALHDAVAAVPAGVSGAEAFQAQLWQALEWERAGLDELETKLVPVVEQHLALYRAALEAVKNAGSQEGEDTADSPAMDDAVRTMYESIVVRTLSEWTAMEKYAQSNMDNADAALAALQTEKDGLRKAWESRERTPEEAERLQRLEGQVDYQTARRKHHHSRVKSIDKELETEPWVPSRGDAATQPASEPSDASPE